MARKAKPPKEKKKVPRAEVDPVARVLVDLPLAHLDRPFDYAVPETMAEDAQPGVRVKVRFAGQDVDGFVIERAATTEHTGALQPLRRVVSAERVLTPDVAALTGAVAARYAGTRSDVLRFAVPPRHATVEKQPSAGGPARDGDRGTARAGRPLLRVAPRSWAPWRRGDSPRAVWTVVPGDDWTDAARRGRRGHGRDREGRAGLRPRPPRRRAPRRGADGPARRGRATWCSLPMPARRSATAPSSRSAGERSGSSSARAPPPSRRCTTSGWWRCGTTATTSTTSRGRRTPTPGRSC